MPNWVYNRVKVNKRYNEIAELVKSDYVDKNGEYEVFDFEKILPMPKSLHITSGGNDRIAIIYALSKKTHKEQMKIKNKFKEVKCSFYGNYYDKFFDKTKYTYTDEEMEKCNQELKDKIKKKDKDLFDNVNYEELKIKNLEDLGNIYINNIVEYGNDSWYDWACKNWGTKWNCCETYSYDNVFEFETAWSCPVEILQVLSKKFNDTTFEVEYADEDIGSNCGKLVIENGEIIDYMEGDTDFALEVWGFDKEEYYADMEEMEEE